MAGSKNNTHYSNGYNLYPVTAGDIVTMQLKTDGVQIINVDGPPNGSEAANPGSIACDRTNGNLWKKQSGTGNTGWEQIASGVEFATQYTTDSGVAVPASNNLNLLGQNLAGSGIQTTALGSTVTHRMLSPYSLAGFSFTGGNLQVIRSNSGSPVLNVVSNTSTGGAGSDAIFQGGVDPSGGDAYLQVGVSGAGAWCAGVRNSDSDAFYLTSGSTLGSASNVMKVTTAGEINYPLQPAFFAYVNTSIPDVSGDGTVYTIIPDVEVFDQNADFNIATGTFTAPVTGRYRFEFLCVVGTGTVITVANMNINTSNNNIQFGMNLSANLATTNVKGIGTQLVDMDAADMAIFTVATTDTGGKIDDVLGLNSGQIRTAISGNLVC